MWGQFQFLLAFNEISRFVQKDNFLPTPNLMGVQVGVDRVNIKQKVLIEIEWNAQIYTEKSCLLSLNLSWSGGVGAQFNSQKKC